MERSYAFEKLSPESEGSSDIFDGSISVPPRRRWWLLLTLIAFSLSIVLNIVSYLRYFDLDYLTIQHTQRYWSPILDSILIPYKPVYFDVTLFSDSIYRQDASPEVHQAWQDLGVTLTQIVPEGDFERVGFTQGMVKLRASEGGGFIAQMEVFHNLHCLDTLRQGLYFNYDYYHANRHGVWERSDAVVRKHMGHCLDLIRLSLQCSADIGLVGMSWVNATGTTVGTAKFVGEHQCRDFEAVKAWALEHNKKGHTELREGDEILTQYP